MTELELITDHERMGPGPPLSPIVVRMRKLFLVLLWFGSTILCVGRPVCLAQTETLPAIRVEAREVVVPVFAFLKISRIGTDFNYDMYGRLGTDKIVEEDKELLGLTAKDFHVFEDGKEQEIQSVTVERSQDWGIRDNVSRHSDWSCTPRSIWHGPDLPSRPFITYDKLVQSYLHIYLISYVPPPSAEGACHRIKVKVDRHGAKVYARDEYCNVKHSLSDPLSGTKLGSQLESYADSAREGAIPVSVEAGSLFGNGAMNLVEIAAEFPWRSLQREWRGDNLFTTIGVLGLVYDKNRTLVARFSDAPCYSKPWHYCNHCIHDRLLLEYAAIPSGHETQIDLPPGDYDLKVIVTDGVKFGRAETPVTVDSYDRNKLAISGIVLSKRFQEGLYGPAQYVPLTSKGLEFTPVADTRFKKGDRLMSYFQIYEPLLAGTGTISVQFQMRVTDVKTGEVKIDTRLRSAESWIRPGNPVIPIAEEIAIDKLPTGTYRLEVQASDSAGRNTLWRAVSLTVE